jgi:hypothetical protein
VRVRHDVLRRALRGTRFASRFGRAERTKVLAYHFKTEDRRARSGITVGQAVAQRLDVVDLEDTMCERYEDLIRIYIRPTFGEMTGAKLELSSLIPRNGREAVGGLVQQRPQQRRRPRRPGLPRR